MTDSERINELLKFTGLNFSKLAKEIGLNTVQTLYDIKNGKHGISKEVAEKIQAKYLNVNLVWLLTGEGEMLTDSQNAVGNGNTQIAGNGNNVNNASTIDKALDEIAEQRKLVSKSQEQIDRLITLLENNINK